MIYDYLLDIFVHIVGINLQFFFILYINDYYVETKAWSINVHGYAYNNEKYNIDECVILLKFWIKYLLHVHIHICYMTCLIVICCRLVVSHDL